MRSLILLLITYLALCNTVLSQFDIPERPALHKQSSLYDYSNLLSTAQQSNLQQKLLRYADSTSTQIVVIIIDSTNGDDISMLSTQWGHAWGIGQDQEDNGIVILLAHQDRKVDISTGYGIEYRVTDLMAERIINQQMIPQFKLGNYYNGIDLGVNALFRALNGEFTEDRTFEDDRFPWFPLLFFIIFIIIIIKSKNNSNNNGSSGTPSLLDVIILSNMGRGSNTFGGGSSNGGSFGGGSFGGGFGGGGFGGGGASGSW